MSQVSFEKSCLRWWRVQINEFFLDNCLYHRIKTRKIYQNSKIWFYLFNSEGLLPPLSFCLSFLLIHWVGKRWTIERAVTHHFDPQRCQVKSKGVRSNWYAFVIFIISHYYHSNSSFHSKVKTLTFMGVSESHYHMQTQHETCIGLIEWRKSTKCLVTFQNWEVPE